MVCKGICIRHKASGPISYGRYATGQKRCQICEIFIKWDGIYCPCCGCRLRIRPRLFKDKAKLRIRQKEKLMEKNKNKNNSNIILYAQ
jgi:hypothetical protein